MDERSIRKTKVVLDSTTKLNGFDMVMEGEGMLRNTLLNQRLLCVL